MIGPVLRDHDSFPLSTYPMFSFDRGRTSHVATVVGVTADGSIERLSPMLIAGSDEPMHAVETVSTAVGAGEERTAQLCAEVALRLASRNMNARAAGARDEIVMVRVGAETHDAVAFFADGAREPQSVAVHAECEVLR